MKKLTLIAALLLAACGGGGDSHVPAAEQTPPTPTPTPAIDAFFTAVSAVVAAAPDESEPANVDAMAATAPDSSDPPSL